MNIGSYRRLGAVVCAMCLSLSLSSCTGEPVERGGTLPPLSPLSPSTSSTSVPASAGATGSQTETAMIRSVYLAFLKSYVRAQGMSPRLRRKYLAQWLAEPRLSETMKSLAYDDRHYMRTKGADRPHIIRIEQDGRRATVLDCLDRTHIYLVDSRTGKEINGARGVGHFLALTSLKKTRAGWRVYKARHQPKRCSYG